VLRCATLAHAPKQDETSWPIKKAQTSKKSRSANSTPIERYQRFTSSHLLIRAHSVSWRSKYIRSFLARSAALVVLKVVKQMRTDVTKVKFVDCDELKLLWRILERLQADVTPHAGRACGYVWSTAEVDALVTVMDAVKDTYQMQPLTDAQKAELERE
jgi:hypothetical protein